MGIIPFGFTACLPPRPLLSQEAGEGQRGRGGGRAREEPHPLSSVNLAGLVRSDHSFLSKLGRLLGLATFSPNFKGGLLVASACSRTSLSGHWGGQSEAVQLWMWGRLVAPKSQGWADFPPPSHMAGLRQILLRTHGDLTGKGTGQGEGPGHGVQDPARLVSWTFLFCFVQA